MNSYVQPVFKGKFELYSVFGLIASLIGLFFSGFSTYDYVAHLDRGEHEIHCSFIPGMLESDSGENPCATALMSPYSSIFRGSLWGGIPISLFALGSYIFFLAFSVYLFLSSSKSSKRAKLAYSITTFFPFFATLIMFVISLTQLGAFCKLCVGLYLASILLFVSGLMASRPDLKSKPLGLAQPQPLTQSNDYREGHVRRARQEAATSVATTNKPQGSRLWIPASLASLGFASLLPSLVYASTAPDYKSKIVSCGKILERVEKHNALLKMKTKSPKREALVFEDPLCVNCRGFHDRLVSENIYENLALNVSLFPLDTECNWMLDKALHPGACMVSRAVICGDKHGRSREVLEWSYKNQDELLELGKKSPDLLKVKIRNTYPELEACLDTKETKTRLDRMLQFAVTNKLPIRTPQFFLGDMRICGEDTDIGLHYTLKQLAPEVVP